MKTLQVFCLMALLAAAAAQASSIFLDEDIDGYLGAGPQCAVQGLCTNTTIIDSVSGKTHAECLKFCQDTANCKWYSYILSSQYCMAFGPDCSIDPKCIDCRSGQTECTSTEPTCEAEGCCSGVVHDLIQNIGTSDECLQKCKDNEACDWYSLDLTSKICLLLEDCSSKPGTCVHGQKVCTGTKCHEDSCCFANSGDLIAIVTATDYNACLDRCQQTPGCKFFTHSAAGVCFLLKKCDTSYDVGLGSCFTGQPACPHDGA